MKSFASWITVLLVASVGLQAQLVEQVDITDIISYDGIYGPWVMDDAGYRLAATEGPSWADYQFYRWTTADFDSWEDWMSPSGFGGWVDSGSVNSIEAIAPNGTGVGQFTWPTYVYDANGDTIPDTLFNAQIPSVADASSWGTWIPIGVFDDSLQFGSSFGKAAVISTDGNVVAGYMSTYSRGNMPFVFRLDSMSLDSLPRLDYSSNASVTGINEDGSVLIGSCSEGWTSYPYIWTRNASGGYDTTRVDSPIVDLENGAISANGEYIVGLGQFTFNGQAAYMMTNINGVDTTYQLPGLPGLLGGISARAVANDGTVFGSFQEAGGPWGGPQHAYMYNYEGGAVDLEYALTQLGLVGPPPQTGPLSMAQVIDADTSGKKLFINYQNDFLEAAYYWVVLPDVAPVVNLSITYTDGNEVTPTGVDLNWENVLPYAYTYKVEYSYKPYGDDWGAWVELATGLELESFHQDITDGGYYRWRVTSQYHGSESEMNESDVYEVRRYADEPTITAVNDVPDDQGGKVFVTFLASGFDILGGMTNELYTIQTLIDTIWVAVANTAAYGADSYAVQVNTINDSMDDGATNAQDFRVVAALGEDVFISSNVMSGYSVDNIAPPVPTGLAGDPVENTGVYLTWNPVNINDLGLYNVYRATDASMSDAVLVGQTGMAEFTDNEVDMHTTATYYYAVSGVDIHANEGEASEAVSVAVLSAGDEVLLPTEVSLSQNYPNPFNPTTSIEFALPAAIDVRIVVYDIAGREIATLVNDHLSAGFHSVRWNGRNNNNISVASGVYIYQLKAGNRVITKSMTYLR